MNRPASVASTTTTSSSSITTNNRTNPNEDLEGNINNNNNINLSDPEEIQAHLQVLDVRQRLRQRRKRMIQLFCIVFVGIAAFFFIKLELFNTSSTSDDDDTNNIESSSSSSSTTVLPQPPIDLSSKCSLMTINKPNGIKVCEEACEISDCCNIPTNFALSCNDKQNEIVCAKYQRYCDILHNLPEDILQQQQGSSSSNNDQQQKEPSSSSSGGVGNNNMDSSSSLITIQEQISQACSNLFEGGGGIVNSPSSMTGGGQNTCEDLCSPSVCCFNHLCNPPPDINCNEYVQCHNLYDDLDTVNDDDQISTNNEGSSQYPTIQEEISNSCQNIDLSTIAKSECEAICAIGSCCFIEDLICPTTDDVIDCQVYQGCHILYDNMNDNSPTQPPAEGDAAIPITARTTSPTSSPIVVVVAPTPTAEATPTTGGGTSSATSLTAEEVNDACNNHNDNSLIRPTLCEQVCTLQVVQCCFHYSYNNNAASQQQGGEGCDEIPCSVYDACDEVLTINPEYFRQSHIDQVNVACNNDSTRNHCVQLCAYASCCYATTIDEECIHVDTTIICSDYEACDVLYQNSNSNNNGNAGGIGGDSDSGSGSR